MRQEKGQSARKKASLPGKRTEPRTDNLIASIKAEATFHKGVLAMTSRDLYVDDIDLPDLSRLEDEQLHVVGMGVVQDI